MTSRRVKALLLACTGIGALCVTSIDANAGGFAVREQSAYGQGSSFAGVAAGGALSSMFWNPATMTQFQGIQSESVLSGIIPDAKHTATTSTLSVFGFPTTAGDSGVDALVPAGYFSYQINPNLWLGMSITAPFGLSVSFPDNWVGRTYAANTTLKTYNATPSIAYQINNMISVGFGVQIQYAKADLSTGLPINAAGVVTGGLGNQLNITGNGWGYGVTAGVTLTPTPTTSIGLGWRSAINQKISGTLTLPPGGVFAAPFSTPGSVNTTLNLPDIVSLGIRQRLTPQWMLMGTIEWSNWSRIGTATVSQPSGAPALAATTAITLPFQYKDGWFYSLGAEYQWNPQLALRAGVAFEKSPITDQVRTPRLPDNDRTWLSIGASYQMTPKLGLDIAYSHIWVKNTPINISAGSGNPWFNGITYIGSVDSRVDIITVGLKYRWDDPAPPAKVGFFKAK
ncbi:MAG: outer membrane protein transport protein [Rhizobiales bacterium]|nr:outer membrane protein transport protein [Hyphomicrobiales bacterium]